MKKISKIVIAILITISANAQEVMSNDSVYHDEPKKNIFKVNVTSLFLNNYSFQYERVLTKRVSIALGYRFMPESDIPLKNQIDAGDDEVADFILENSKISNMAITPEIRFYLGKKGYGRGFYVAPYYRYTKFSTDEFLFEYEGDLGEKDFKMSGDVSSHSGGIMFGAQWSLGKHISLDWWIIGGHYGTSKGDLSGTPDTPLTPIEQQAVRDVLEDFEIPLVDSEVDVTATRARMRLDGPWAGVRAGISIGYKF